MEGVNAESVSPQWQMIRVVGNEWDDGSDWGPLERRVKDVLFKEKSLYTASRKES